ncbi:MAG: hypothetical protein DWQ34_02605 [Planctomycetota bacterium]|nr:MAG: hypothetical protein DWQ29_17035 [Planctomycetota bacterium]REJ97233.1 MAG: hypothetical protein DWQ34_02605 [Planctomycetota bacterium]REK30317.1 MAG: hypothetical protein DWQ41_02155 [Planctomycetota bacterium]REK31532.1 MAG: hypothetical protein DWQ45_19605 [Planctomycetota bacterium]
MLRRSLFCCRCILAPLVLVAIYLASVGPYVALRDQRAIPKPIARFYDDIIYRPLMWAEFNTRFYDDNPIGITLVRYIGWCESVIESD